MRAVNATTHTTRLVSESRSTSTNPIGQDFALSERFLTPLLSAFVVESLLYGIHVTLFFFCLRTLLRRRRARRSRLQLAMLIAVVVMFALATADVAISWHVLLSRTWYLYTGTTTRLQKALYPKFAIHLINNIIADCLLIARCYIVWGNRNIVIFIGGLVLIVGALFGIVSAAVTRLKDLIAVYVITIFVLNIVLTAFTAGRIMWIAREVKKALGAQMASYYHFAVGVLIESGMIYTASTLLVVIFAKSIWVMMAVAIVLRVVCIGPILIIVQIALGQSTSDVKTTVTRFQGGTQQIVLDTIMSDGYEPEAEENNEQAGDEEMTQRRPSVGISTIIPKS
ncbi:hypothetical protein BDN70DRAFT_222544 [Pholiota conissans]|uniref:Uncharacterized protein n=1 Tax=Pholiota conissans TaxID=109636 RepID=A0A9P5YW36_9AGAR|nr:hypothetical protein BDN70DRAFT_222544 [Pholiota conissans]